MPVMICDFCIREAELVADYHPTGLLIAQLGCKTFIDNEAWGACYTCSRLIAERDYATLMERCVPGIIRVALKTGHIPDVVAIREQMKFTLGYVLGVAIE